MRSMGSSHSPTTATEAFSAFVSNLPPNVDPFNATAQWLIETQSAAVSVGSENLSYYAEGLQLN